MRIILKIFILLLASLFISFAIGRAVQKPYIEGKLDIESDGVYLNDIPVEFSPTSNRGVIPWQRNSSELLEDPSSEPGYVVHLIDNNGYDDGKHSKKITDPTIKVPEMTVPINAKFDRLKGRFSILDGSNASQSDVTITIEGESRNVLWEETLGATPKKSLYVDIPLDSQRSLKFSVFATNTKKGEKIYLGLSGFSLTKDGAEPKSFDYIQNPRSGWEPPLRKIFFSPESINDKTDSSYLSTSIMTNFGSNIKLEGYMIFWPKESPDESLDITVLPNNNYGRIAFSTEDILVKGGTAKVEWNDHFRKCRISEVNITSGESMQVYIPQGTVVNDLAYRLHQDYVIADIYDSDDLMSATSEARRTVLMWFAVAALILLGLFLLIRGKSINMDSAAGSLAAAIIPAAIFTFLILLPNMASGTSKTGAMWCNILAAIPMAAILFSLFLVFLESVQNNGIVAGSIICIVELIVCIFLILIGFGIAAVVLGVLLVLVKGLFDD